MLNVAFIWHLHQPYYKDPRTGRFSLPWTRLHAVKDYLHLASILNDYPTVHQTFNLVPSLVEQLIAYGSGHAVDQALAVSRQLAWSDEDKRYLLRVFFSINVDHFIRRYPRYEQLLRLRETVDNDVNLLSADYWRDLIAWFNLAWIDPTLAKRDPALSQLVAKARNFSPDDIALILERHHAMCADVLPAFRALAARGQVELSASAYYHPILPLLLDLDAGREASPNLPRPRLPFPAADDAARQLRDAMAYHQEIFGQPPAGLWPSEGAISGPTIDLLRQFTNLRWVASDEHVLARSRGISFDRDGYGQLHDPRPLYQPYRYHEGPGPALIFRDQILSDRIGFVYQHMDSQAAAADLLGRLRHMAQIVANDDEPYLCAIILDGENCWESYPNNGEDFLRALFAGLAAEKSLRTVTPVEYLADNAPRQTLDRLVAGSWIGSNLETWIGEPEQNRAWEYLALARAQLVQAESDASQPPENLAEAWREIRIAEGSDWFWWYYSRNRLGGEQVFDTDFRLHLANVYRLIGAPVPVWVEWPIAGQAPERNRLPSHPITPPLTGAREAGPDWDGAGYSEPFLSTGSMQRGGSAFQRLYYGYSATDLFVRIETTSTTRISDLALYLGASGASPANDEPRGVSPDSDHSLRRLAWETWIPAQTDRPPVLARAAGAGQWQATTRPVEVVRGPAIVELRLPLSTIDISFGSSVQIVATISRDGQLVEQLPEEGAIVFPLGVLC